ncbi:MAG: hypothetical protein GC192_18670 [Bacteroidetes bacterium]|nr:hypothetical protein [Bacteroidota bacterium]
MRLFIFFFIILLLVGCYEPKSGCLDLDATNYDASADDQCPTCCKYPKLSLQVQHYVTPPSMPDTSYSMKYATKYQSTFDTNDFFFIDRGRFFISDVKLVRTTGEEVGVMDSVWLPTKTADSIFLENNFSKHDRDIFQAATLGTVRTVGMFSRVKFTLGLPQIVLDTVPIDSVKTGNALAVKNDTLSYDSLTGIIPNHLIFRPDTLDDTVPIDFRFYVPKQLSLDFAQPVSVERGFNIKLVIRLDYTALFRDVDFKHDTPDMMRTKIDSQLTNGFSVVSIKLE